MGQARFLLWVCKKTNTGFGFLYISTPASFEKPYTKQQSFELNPGQQTLQSGPAKKQNQRSETTI